MALRSSIADRAPRLPRPRRRLGIGQPGLRSLHFLNHPARERRQRSPWSAPTPMRSRSAPAQRGLEYREPGSFKPPPLFRRVSARAHFYASSPRLRHDRRIWSIRHLTEAANALDISVFIARTTWRRHSGTRHLTSEAARLAATWLARSGRKMRWARTTACPSALSTNRRNSLSAGSSAAPERALVLK